MDLKQVIIVNKELGMRKGKIAAQVAHAAVKCAIYTFCTKPDLYQAWDDAGHKKVCIEAENKEQCEKLFVLAMQKEIVASKIIDQGLTQIPPNSLTCVAIGPDDEAKIDEITGALKLLN